MIGPPTPRPCPAGWRSWRACASFRSGSSAPRCPGIRCALRSRARASRSRRSSAAMSSVDRVQIEQGVVEALRQVYDPEIPVNIHELGLIYGVDVDPAGAVAVRMTLTAAGCPAAQVLPEEVERRVRDVPGVTDVRVEVTFDPPWDQSRMSEAARLQLGLL